MPEIIRKNASRYTQKNTEKSFVLFAIVTNLLLPFLNTIYRSVPRLKEQDKVHRFTYRDPVAPSFAMTNLPPTRQWTNDLMLLFAEGTRRASGRWSATKLSNKIRPRRSHGRGGRPSPLHTFAGSPSPCRRGERVALLMLRVPDGQSGSHWHGRAAAANRSPLPFRGNSCPFI